MQLLPRRARFEKARCRYGARNCSFKRESIDAVSCITLPLYSCRGCCFSGCSRCSACFGTYASVLLQRMGETLEHPPNLRVPVIFPFVPSCPPPRSLRPHKKEAAHALTLSPLVPHTFCSCLASCNAEMALPATQVCAQRLALPTPQIRNGTACSSSVVGFSCPPA